jgi:hypothetical protein
MTRVLCDGYRVEIRGFCAFKIKNYKGYTGRNPKSGKHVTVKPKKLPFFKAGAEPIPTTSCIKRATLVKIKFFRRIDPIALLYFLVYILMGYNYFNELGNNRPTGPS